MTGPLGAAFSASSLFGRYFSVVNTASSTVLVAFTYAVVVSGAFSGQPSIDGLVRTIANLSVGDAALLVLLALIVSLTLHPLQYALVQLFEGYWGSRAFAVRAMGACSALHHSRVHRLRSLIASADQRLVAIDRARAILS